MDIAKGVVLDLVGGKVVLSADLASLIVPALESIKAKLESGELDPIKGTDLDKLAIEQAIALVEKALA